MSPPGEEIRGCDPPSPHPLTQYVAGGTLTDYVSERWTSVDERGGLFMTEGEARYFFRVSENVIKQGVACLSLNARFR